jgi:2-polyprenyl-6-methoxyphenol hydroxylase-like FAD-dependent oxidoreductase
MVRILIVGAGPAGLTLAGCLLQRGLQPTIVEKAPVARTDGYAVGLHLNGWNVADRLGVLEALRRNAMPLGEALYRDQAGRRLFSYDYGAIADSLGGKMIAIMRDVLQRELLQAVQSRVPIAFDTTVAAFEPRADKVDVTFADGRSDQFDLVVGADGIHSRVRELAFGSESQFIRPLGYRAAAWRMQAGGPLAASFVGHMAVNRQAALYRVSDDQVATLFCWRDADTAYVPPEQRQAVLISEFGGWTEQIANAVRAPIDWSSAFFDTVAQIVMPSWSAERVVLIGDAAHCQTFFSGQGTSMAMAGAFILAEELGRCGPLDAVATYERRMRGTVERLQEASKLVGGKFVPTSRFGIWMQSRLAGLLLSRQLVSLFTRRLRAPDLLA